MEKSRAIAADKVQLTLKIETDNNDSQTTSKTHDLPQEQEVTVPKPLKETEFSCLLSGFISESLLKRIGRSVFAHIDLDAIAENLTQLKKRCSNTDIKIMGVVKNNSYSHGAVPVSRYLTEVKAVDRLAVANIPEAIQLRRAGVEGVIHVLGNTQPWAMDHCIQYQLVPTVATQEAVRGMAEAIEKYKRKVLEEKKRCEETTMKYEEQIRVVEAMMNQFIGHEKLIGLPYEISHRSNETSEIYNYDENCSKLEMFQLLSNLCNDRINQLSNEVNQLRQRSQSLGYLIRDKEILTEKEARQGSGTTYIADASREGSNCDDKSNEKGPWSCSCNESKDASGTVENDVGDYKDDVISKALDDVTLRYKSGLRIGTIHIKVDTGMSRNGCQPQELDSLVQICRDTAVPLEGIFSHMSNLRDNVYCQHQLDTFKECTAKYAGQGIMLHIANSGSVLRDIGTDMDMIRPGLVAFGMSSDLGFRPAMTLKGTPNLVKLCLKGTKIGYGCDYTCTEDEWIATFPIGYADGIGSDKPTSETEPQYVIRDLTGDICPVVGRISMDAITVRVPEKPEPGELFTLISAEHDTVALIPDKPMPLRPIDRKYLKRLSSRLPRIYWHRTLSHTEHSIWPALDLGLSAD